MPSFIYDKEQDKLVSSEEYRFEQYMKKDHLHMTKPNSNEKVTLYYNSDSMEPTRHMCSGKYFTSKKKYRDETRAYGCIEVGNETKSLVKPKRKAELDRRKRRNDIKKAIYDLKNGNSPRQ